MKAMLSTKSPFRSVRPATRQGWLGVDIGTTAVKTAQVRRRRDGWEVLHTQLFAVTEGGDPLTTAEAAVGAVFGPRRPWINPPAACVMTSRPDLRSVDIPVRSAHDALREVSQQIAATTGDVALVTWPSTWEAHDANTVPYHVIAMSERAAVNVGKSVMSGKAACEVLEALPFTLARLVRIGGHDTPHVIAIVDWAAENPIFVLVRDGQPFFTRLLRQCSFGDLVRAVCDGLGLEVDEGWSLLSRMGSRGRRKSDASELAKTVHQLTQATRQRFVDEINRTLAFLRSESGELVPEQLWLVGGGASLPHVVAQIRDATKISTAIWRLRTGSDAGSAATPSSPDPLFATAISLSALPFVS